MERNLRVGIIGGGIGGLALAGTLSKFGMEAHVFERAPAFGEIGAGIQMTPNAVKIMRALDLWDDLNKASFRPQCLVGRDGKTGREMFRTPLFDECPKLYGAEFFHVHRADVHRILLSLLPKNAGFLSKRCISVDQNQKTAVARFEDGSEYEADVIVGADGIHSVVRQSLYGNDAPRYTGNMCWRAVTTFDKPVDFVSPDASFWLGPNGHVVTYYVRGGAAVNMVAILESEAWVEESWNVPSTREELMANFRGWHPNLQKLFAKAQNVFKWGLFDRDPMPAWSSGRITLLGDAAHPMLPFLSQGAAMAIEDGYVLARVLANAANPVAALKEYEQLRLPRTSKVQLESRKRGETYHLASPLKRLYRDVMYRIRQMIDPHSGGIKANWVYAYDAVSEPSQLSQTV
jgi:2-polyprenyl-6-methoxyphenol hydroxylase-like FAD-dependent oxidoreductase